jgi:hypothetical protein
MHKEGVIRPGADDADLDAIFRVPAGEAIKTIEPVAAIEIIAGTLTVDGECVGIKRDIDRTPPNFVFRYALFDNTFVLRRTPGLDAGIGYEGTVLGNMSIFLMEDGVFVKGARRLVAVNIRNGDFVVLKVE